MHIEIGHHAARHELLADKILHEPDRLDLAQLARQSEFDLARQHRVITALDGRDLVPQHLAIEPARRRAHGQQNFGMHHTGLGQKVLRPAEFCIIKRLGRPVGCSRNDAPPLRALDHLRLQMVDRHWPIRRCLLPQS
jgi:hypothetical protein